MSATCLPVKQTCARHEDYLTISLCQTYRHINIQMDMYENRVASRLRESELFGRARTGLLQKVGHLS